MVNNVRFVISKDLALGPGTRLDQSRALVLVSSVAHYQRNANQNHNEVPLHTSQNGCRQKVYKQMLERVWRKGNPLTLLVGMQTSTATMENSVEIP